MFAPNTLKRNRLAEKGVHGTPNVEPVRTYRLGKHRVTARDVNELVEANISLDQGLDIATGCSALTGADERATLAGEVSAGLGRRTCRSQAIEHGSHPIALDQLFALQRRDTHASPSLGVVDKTLATQKHQGLQHRLTRNA